LLHVDIKTVLAYSVGSLDHRWNEKERAEYKRNNINAEWLRNCCIHSKWLFCTNY